MLKFYSNYLFLILYFLKLQRLVSKKYQEAIFPETKSGKMKLAKLIFVGFDFIDSKSIKLKL